MRLWLHSSLSSSLEQDNTVVVLLSSAILVLAAAPAACCTCSLHTDARHRSQRRTRSRLPRPGGRRSRTPRARTSPSRQAHTGRCGLTRGRSRRAGCAQRRGSYTSTAQHPTRHSQPCEAHTPHHAHTYPRPPPPPLPTRGAQGKRCAQKHRQRDGTRTAAHWRVTRQYASLRSTLTDGRPRG